MITFVGRFINGVIVPDIKLPLKEGVTYSIEVEWTETPAEIPLEPINVDDDSAKDTN